MKGKHLAILLLLVAVVGGASWLLLQRDQSSWTDKTPALGQKVLNLPLNDVAHIVVKAVEGDMNLVKKNDLWVVSERGDYPANFEQVSTLLRKVWDLKSVQVVKVGPSQLDRVGLVEPGKEGNSGILVDFLDKDGKRLDALLLGKAYTKKATGDLAALGDMPVGRYVRPVKENAPVSLVSENFEGVTPDIPRWLDHDFFKVTDPLSITLAGLTDAQHWKLTRENSTAEWTLADPKPGEELDKNKLFSITSTFTTPAFIDVVKLEATPAEVGLDKPTVVTLETAEHFVYTVKLGKLNTDYYPVAVTVTANLPKERTPGKGEKPEDKQKLDAAFQADQKRLQEKLAGEKKFESRVYLMQKSALDSILKDRSALMADKKTDAPAPGEAPFIPPPQAPITLPIPVPAPVVPPAPAPAAPAPAAPAPAPAPAPEAAPSASAPAPAAPAPTSATTPPVQAPAPAADQPAEAK